MLPHLRPIIPASALLITISCFPSGPAFANNLNPPQTPAELQAPAGHILFLKGQASGTQNYICLPGSSGMAWTFLGPQATLFYTMPWFSGEVRQQIMTHFLSANPDEAGALRATWQSSFDTSRVWARAVASSTNPAYVAPGSIPWLLLQVVGTERGPAKGASLTAATYIQRVQTDGGVAPATGCSEAADLGRVVHVPYTTDYYFYRSQRSSPLE